MPSHPSFASGSGSLGFCRSLLGLSPANRTGLRGFPLRILLNDRGRSRSNLLNFASPSKRLATPRLFGPPCGHGLLPSHPLLGSTHLTPLPTYLCASTPGQRKRHPSAGRCHTTSLVPPPWFLTTSTVYSNTQGADIAACCQPGFVFSATRPDVGRSQPRAFRQVQRGPGRKIGIVERTRGRTLRVESWGRRCGRSQGPRAKSVLKNTSLPKEGCSKSVTHIDESRSTWPSRIATSPKCRSASKQRASRKPGVQHRKRRHSPGG